MTLFLRSTHPWLKRLGESAGQDTVLGLGHQELARATKITSNILRDHFITDTHLAEEITENQRLSASLKVTLVPVRKTRVYPLPSVPFPATRQEADAHSFIIQERLSVFFITYIFYFKKGKTI